jgi:5-methylcytosine-specific restriction endonuclease McrA
MICEFSECNNFKDQNYGSGRFCSPLCAKKYSSNSRTLDTNAKVSESLKKYFAENPGVRPGSNRTGVPQSEETKTKISEKLKKFYIDNPKPRDPNSVKLDMAKYMKERRAKTREFAIEYLSGKCAKCGAEPDDDFQFDHIIPRKNVGGMTISSMAAHGRKRLIEELDKCQLLCIDCHRKKTNIDMGYHIEPEHGTISMYSHYNCRCIECKKVHAKTMQEYRMKHGRKKYGKELK